MISATQLDKSECPRRWAWEYIAGHKEPSGSGAGFGSELHTVAEDYLRDGKAPDPNTEVGARFLPGLKFLPPPGTGGVEGKFEAVISGVPYVLIIDWSGVSTDLPKAPDGLLATLDHKTSKSPKKHGLWGEDAFLNHPQPLLYLTGALVRAKRRDGDLFARWLYYDTGTTRPRALPSDVVLPAKRVIEAFGDVVHPRAHALVQLEKKRADPLTLPPNLTKCDLYPPKGCPHRHRCTDLTALDHFRAQSKAGGNDMGLLDELKAAAAAPTKEQPAAQVTTPAQDEAQADATVNAVANQAINPAPRKAAAEPDIATAFDLIASGFTMAAKALRGSTR